MSSKKAIETKEAGLPEPDYHFLTIRWDENDDLVLDLGDLSVYEALGAVRAAEREIEERCPPIEVRFNGEPWEDPWLAEDESEDGESEN